MTHNVTFSEHTTDDSGQYNLLRAHNKGVPSSVNLWMMAETIAQHITDYHAQLQRAGKRLIVGFGEQHSVMEHAILQHAVISILAEQRDAGTSPKFNIYLEGDHTFLNDFAAKPILSANDADLRAVPFVCSYIASHKNKIPLSNGAKYLNAIRRDITMTFVDAKRHYKTPNSTNVDDIYIDIADDSIESKHLDRVDLTRPPEDFERLTHEHHPSFLCAEPEGMALRNLTMSDLMLQHLYDTRTSLGVLFTGAAHLAGIERLTNTSQANDRTSRDVPFKHSLCDIFGRADNHCAFLAIAPFFPERPNPTPRDPFAVSPDNAYTADLYHTSPPPLVYDTGTYTESIGQSFEANKIKELTKAFPAFAHPKTPTNAAINYHAFPKDEAKKAKQVVLGLLTQDHRPITQRQTEAMHIAANTFEKARFTAFEP